MKGLLLAAALLAASPALADDLAANMAVVTLSPEALAERRIVAQPLGPIPLPTGRLVAADPLVQPDTPPFARTVPPGRYEAVAYRAPEFDDRVGLLELRLGDAPPVRWELAVWPETRALEPGTFVGVPVDAGVAGFWDAETTARLTEAQRDVEPGARDDALLNFALDPPAPWDARAMVYPVDPDHAMAIVSGWGDGYYPVFWGLAADGTAVRAVLDLHVFTNADGRDPLQLRYDAAVAALTDDERAAGAEAFAALRRKDYVALDAVLRSGRFRVDMPVPGATAARTLGHMALAAEDARALGLLSAHGLTRRLPAYDRYGDDETLLTVAERQGVRSRAVRLLLNLLPR